MRLACYAWLLYLAAGALIAGAQAPRELAVEEVTQKWQIGVRVQAAGGAVSGIEASMPFPLEWPEQDVRIVATDRTDNIKRLAYHSLGNGAEQLVVEIGRLQAGESAVALVTVELRRRIIKPPVDPGAWRVPQSIPKSVKSFLLPSPYIDSRHKLIRKVARDLQKESPTSDWQRVEHIYDWVRKQVRYEFDPKIRSSVEALQAGHGDCEELTSLFIAICRAQRIPARAVWVPGHCYPEFYLENSQGSGAWFPCQAAGSKLFGEMIEWRPILQKGDRFKVRGKRGWQRYVAESLRAKDAAAAPKVEFVREPLGDAVATKLAE